MHGRRAAPRELRGFDDDQAPRLTYSNRYFSRQGAWWQAALRLVSLARALDLLAEGDPNAQAVQALPAQIDALCFGAPPASPQAAAPDPLAPHSPTQAIMDTNLSNARSSSYHSAGTRVHSRLFTVTFPSSLVAPPAGQGQW